MSLSDIKSQIICGFSNSTDDHVAIEPILLMCGHNGCLACIDSLKEVQIECIHCKHILKKDDMASKIPNQAVKMLMSGFLKELNEELDLKMKKSIDLLSGKNNKIFKN